MGFWNADGNFLYYHEEDEKSVIFKKLHGFNHGLVKQGVN